VAAAQGLVYEANLGKEHEAQANYEKAVVFGDVARARPSTPARRRTLPTR
jgi:hypothetical protein